MAVRKILTYGNPLLRKMCRKIPEITEDVRKLAADMLDTITEEHGLGLAAPQVGVSVRMICVNLKPEEEEADPRAFINPEIIEAGEEIIRFKEGCLSVPEVNGMVERRRQVTLSALNLQGEKMALEANDLLAVVFQHEIDHLDGVLFVDKISMQDRALVEPSLKALASRNKKQKAPA